jgi:hypothetical protein
MRRYATILLLLHRIYDAVEFLTLKECAFIWQNSAVSLIGTACYILLKHILGFTGLPRSRVDAICLSWHFGTCQETIYFQYFDMLPRKEWDTDWGGYQVQRAADPVRRAAILGLQSTSLFTVAPSHWLHFLCWMFLRNSLLCQCKCKRKCKHQELILSSTARNLTFSKSSTFSFLPKRKHSVSIRNPKV